MAVKKLTQTGDEVQADLDKVEEIKISYDSANAQTVIGAGGVNS